MKRTTYAFTAHFEVLDMRFTVDPAPVHVRRRDAHRAGAGAQVEDQVAFKTMLCDQELA